MYVGGFDGGLCGGVWGDRTTIYNARTHHTQLKLLLQQVEQQLERKQREMMEWKVRGILIN